MIRLTGILKYRTVLISLFLLVSFLSIANIHQNQDYKVYYLLDKQNKYDLKKAKELFEAGKFKTSTKTLNFGYTVKNVWVVITKTEHTPHVLTIKNPHLDLLTLYFFDNESLTEKKVSGDNLPFSNRFSRSNFFNFLIPEGTTHIYLHVSSESLLHLPLDNQLLPSYIYNTNLYYLIYGIFYGFLILTLVSSLELYIWLKDPLHLHYSLFLIILGITIGIISNLFFQFIYPNNPEINRYVPIIMLSTIYFLYFTDRLLNIKNTLPNFHHLYKLIYFLVPVLVVIFLFSDYHTSIKVVYYVVIFVPIISLFSSLLLLKKEKTLYNNLFLVGWILFIISLIVYYLLVSQLISFFFIPSESILLGASLQVMFFNLAMFSKVNTLQREKQDILADQNRILESLVSKRTAELENKKNEISFKNKKLEAQKEELEQINNEVQEKNELLSNQQQDLEKIVEKRTEELTRINQNLLESERQFKFLADTIPQIVHALSNSGKLEYINSKWTSYTGQTFEDLKKRGWKEYFHPEDWQILKEKWSEASKNGTPLDILLRILRASDNTFRWHITRTVPFKNVSGEIVRWFGTSTDIHDEKVNQEKVKEANKELKKINQDLDNFIYLASHEIRVPVANIEALISDLRETIEEHNIQEPVINTLINMILQSLSILKAIVNDLIQISALQRKEEYKITEVNVSEVIEDVKSQIKNLVENTNADLNAEKIECSEIRFSKEKLRSIFYHLLSNAILYRHPERKPIIKVTCQISNGYYLITVSDNGLGISKESQHKLFRMFRRIHTHVEGVGIGLYTVKRILENFSGRIEVESEEGVGSTFKVYIPVNPPE